MNVSPRVSGSKVRTYLGRRHLCLSAMAIASLSLPALAADRTANATGAAARPAALHKAPNAVARLDGAAIRANETRTPEWPSYGLDYAESRFSKLDQVNAGNVMDLGLAWSYDLESTRGVEATPLVVDGVMYVSAPWSVVHAIDARTGKRLWTYDPQVPRDQAYKGCCDVVNRGVALYKGKVFVGAFDGRLVAIDAATGKKVWEQDTIVDRSRSYTITGAPRVYNGKVIIGNGGAEYGVRGYITAYDAETGAQKWRWYTVPGDPSKPFENEAMAKAAATWDPSGKYWVNGGGGTVWNTMAFDPELNLMYIGTGNAGPWSRKLRSPKGGDNLYAASVVALNPDTGEYAWHYQETPGDNWDYTSTQDIILADLKIDGQVRKVLLHAPKNGFFFVIDRTNGKFISAKNFVDVNWASGYDKDGRPIETPQSDTSGKPVDIVPGPFGGHNWHSMSFHPKLGLAYIPAQHVPLTLADNKEWVHNQKDSPEAHRGVGWNLGMLVNAEAPRSQPMGRLVAWDPLKQKAVWHQDHAGPWNGGTLATAGNLVFQGTADGRLVAYHAGTGDKLWQVPTGSGVVAAPVTYMLDGKQYVSIAVGWGGVYGLSQRGSDKQAPGRVYTFVLGGKKKMPESGPYPMAELLSGVKYDPARVADGQKLYVNNCVFCHGVPGVDKGGNIPNLAYVGAPMIEHLDKILFNGPFVQKGMPDFTGKLTAEDVVKIQAFIQGTADAVRPKKP